MTKTVFQLDTLTCPTCAQKIEGSLSKKDGVENVKVLFNSSKAKIDYDESKVSPEDLVDVVESLGFDVLGIK